jgi:hypothetical protein
MIQDEQVPLGRLLVRRSADIPDSSAVQCGPVLYCGPLIWMSMKIAEPELRLAMLAEVPIPVWPRLPGAFLRSRLADLPPGAVAAMQQA